MPHDVKESRGGSLADQVEIVLIDLVNILPDLEFRTEVYGFISHIMD